MYFSLLFFEISLAGIPAIVQLSSLKDLLTTEFAPIAVFLPISIGPKIFTPGAT